MFVHKLSLTRPCEAENARFTTANEQFSAEAQRSQRGNLWTNTKKGGENTEQIGANIIYPIFCFERYVSSEDKIYCSNMRRISLTSNTLNYANRIRQRHMRFA
ncbi:MAG: hypothetical protein ACOCPM_05605 [Bacteroidales bacterium]